jgi:spore photoproduct lyase
MKDFTFETIYVDKKIKEHPLTKSILKQSSCQSVEYISDPKLPAPAKSGKRNLLLTEQKGNFIKRCPGTKRYICCNYYFLNFSTNCPLECTYCILQSYINDPLLKIFVNLDKLSDDLDQFAANRTGRIFRVGSGELTDSLVLENMTFYSKNIIPLFSRYDNVLLELKTKTAHVSGLPVLKKNEKVVASWSLNPDSIIKKEERKTAPLQARLDAAQVCQKKGYKIGFHFDPIIHYPSWEKDYRGVVKKLFKAINPENIIWISLGGLRFNPPLRSIAGERFPKTEIFLGEFVPCPDGKMRYVKPIRIDMYRKMVAWIKEASPDQFIYFCMESRDVWKKAIGSAPRSNRDLDRLFSERIISVYG